MNQQQRRSYNKLSAQLVQERIQKDIEWKKIMEAKREFERLRYQFSLKYKSEYHKHRPLKELEI